MTTTLVRRIVSLCFVLSVAAGGLANPAPAQAQNGQQRAAEGSHVWAEDGWLYVIQGGRMVRTGYFRVFPDPTNRTVFNIYQNGQFLRRVVASPQPAAGNRQTVSAEAEVQRLIDQLNQLTAAAKPAEAPRDPGAMAFCPPITGPLLATNVRESMPMYGCQTREEKAFVARHGGAILTADTIRRMGLACDNMRAGRAYRAEVKRPNGVFFQLDDGSEHPRGGTLNKGWMWGTNGMPQHAKVCF